MTTIHAGVASSPVATGAVVEVDDVGTSGSLPGASPRPPLGAGAGSGWPSSRAAVAATNEPTATRTATRPSSNPNRAWLIGGAGSAAEHGQPLGLALRREHEVPPTGVLHGGRRLGGVEV